MGMTPCMRLLLGPNDLQASNQSTSSLNCPHRPRPALPPLLFRYWGYLPSKAWKRSLCSTVRRGGAHLNSGGARSQRADLGAEEMQVRIGGLGQRRKTELKALTSSFLAFAFSPQALWKGSRRRLPRVSASHSTLRPLLHKDTCFSPLGLSDISLFSHFNLPNPPVLELSCLLPHPILVVR